MLQEWLKKYQLELPLAGETLRIKNKQSPDVLLERFDENYLLAVKLGDYPGKVLQGVMLQLLQVNNPFSALYPVRLTADVAGDLLLWLPLSTEATEDECDSAYYKLLDGHQALSPMLNPPDDDITKPSEMMFV
ncbi:hypothetical protein [Photorhabdus australis]|uniref:hypothetical protein n=1 Tax=Photorhabdus australis TaxID=286156 RepID=UPI0005670DBE|nr:hypothetical protein [Photorhabdus australis]